MDRHVVHSTGHQCPTLCVSVNITKDTFRALLTVNSKGFRSSVPEIGKKTKNTFLIVNHTITAPELWTDCRGMNVRMIQSKCPLTGS